MHTSYSLTQYAEATGALLAQIEHRYFGESVPFGPITNTLTYNWDYLTLDNVMSDSVDFVREIKKNSTLTDAMVVVFGGSYGAFLTTMLRLNHGDVFEGAVASAAPFFLNAAAFPNNSHNDVSPLWVNNVIQDISLETAKNIKGTYDIVSEQVRSGKAKQLSAELNLCTDLRNQTDVDIFNGIFADGLQRLSQFNFPYAAVVNVTFPIQYIVGKTANSTDPLAALKAFIPIYAEAVDPDSLNCFNWEAGGAAGQGGGGVEDGPYFHLVCTYFPISVEKTPPGTIFPPGGGTQYPCGELFGPGKTKMLTQSQLASQYNYSVEKISALTNFVATYGQYDPVTGLFPFDFPLRSSRAAARKIFVSEMAHTGDLVGQTPLDPQPVIDVRNTILQYVLAWNEGMKDGLLQR